VDCYHPGMPALELASLTMRLVEEKAVGFLE
jgi:hypothetical protein